MLCCLLLYNSVNQPLNWGGSNLVNLEPVFWGFLMSVKWYLTAALICIPLMISDVEHLSCACIFFREMSGFLSVFGSGCCCCSCWVFKVLCIFWILIPYQMYDLPVFSPILPLYSVDGVFWCKEKKKFRFSWSLIWLSSLLLSAPLVSFPRNDHHIQRCEVLS